jgi:hypothetical protein
MRHPLIIHKYVTEKYTAQNTNTYPKQLAATKTRAHYHIHLKSAGDQ